MKIGITSDAKCFFLKQSLKRHIESSKSSYDITDLGAFNEFDETNYEQLANISVDFIHENKNSICFLVDITGSGIAMYANKFEDIKAASCFNVLSTQEALEECDANMFSISSLTDVDEAILIIDIILNHKNELAK